MLPDVPTDFERLALVSRTLRRRQQLRQVDLVRDGRSLHFVRAVEAGDAARLAVGDLRAHFDLLGARLRITAFWNGAELDRLLDGEHAKVVERSIAILNSYSWLPVAEVTFAEYGERGSIDIFAAHEGHAAVFVGEA